MDKAAFYRHYANLPFAVRREVVLSIDGEPITWEVAYREIDADTERGKRILQLLIQLKFIPAN
ncbi:MAG: hypothetical protein AAB567_00400 [Patescibacteria group bacterium]